jgi:hypothetical protein
MQRHFIAVSVCALLMGCSVSSGYTGSYVGGDETALVHLDLVESGEGQLNGTIAVSEIDYEAGRLKTTTKPITGVRDGKQISLRAHAETFGAKDASLSLEASGNSLMWKVPTNGQTIELSQTDQPQYRERLAKFADQLNANDVGLLPDDL